ncbi:acyltransferase [Microbacterium sp. MYb64]|uniref:acyltransferase family protein n=1 Tax=Microbacterium sp. MYb64 TaxID=1848691 RepID=UPI0015E36190|nr:acyltransferase [Microbacterium sp. MYb64]
MSPVPPDQDLVRPAASASTRFVALDGLRGVAAVIVVAYHVVLGSAWGDAYLAALAGARDSPTPVRLLADTPIRYLLMGPEAVVVFFVLSGFVLVFPMLQGRGLDLWSYYPRRVLRLWLPSAGAMAFAIIVILLGHQKPETAPSEWARAFSFSTLSPSQIVDSFFLITGSTQVNNPLWSLRWELLFSLMLPVAFLAVARIARGHWYWLIACGAVTAVGTVLGVQALIYGPMFLAGCVAAVMRSQGAAPRGKAAPWILVLAGVLALGLPDVVRVGLPDLVPGGARGALQGFVAIGAALVVLGLSAPSGLARLLGTAPFRFLGRISFSLYLVHMPILLQALQLAPGTPHRALLISVPVAVLVAWLFARFVEEPSARLARAVGRSASERVRAISRPSAEVQDR